MHKKALRLCFAAVLSASFSSAFAQGGGSVGGSNPNSLVGDQNRAILTAVPFLTITPDARAAGMGDQGTATSADVYSAFWNPGKLAFNTQDMGAAISFTPWLRNLGINDMYLFNGTGYYKMRKQDAIGLGMTYFSLGQLTFTDNTGNKVLDFNPNEFNLYGTYSRQLGEGFGAGVTAKYVYSNLAGSFSNQTGVQGRPANTVAVDLGAYYNREVALGGSPGNFSLGASLSNFGPKVSYTDNNQRDFIPTTLRLGSTLTTELDAYNRITFSLEAGKLLVPTPGPERDSTLMGGFFQSFYYAPGGAKEKFQEVMLSGGVEYWYDNVFAIRGGYFHESPNKGNRRYFTAGLGFRYQKFGIDLAYLIAQQTNHPLSNTLRFSILFLFDKQTAEDNSVTE